MIGFNLIPFSNGIMEDEEADFTNVHYKGSYLREGDR